MNGKRSYHHGDLRNALLEAALELIRERGARGFSVVEAARRAGVSSTAPYRHFADRDALLAAVAQQGFLRLTEELRSFPPEQSLEDRASAVAVKYVRFAEMNPAYFEVMFAGGLEKTNHPELLQQADKVQGLLESTLEPYPLMPDRALRAAELWTVAHGIAVLVAEGGLAHVIPTSQFEELTISVTRAWATGVAVCGASRNTTTRARLLGTPKE